MSGIHEWIITQGAVRHALENDFNSVQRIFTDGRAHTDPDIVTATYTGDNTGHWECDVLIIDTVALRDDTWLDDLGHDHSDQTHIITRVIRLPDGRLRAQAQIEDPVASPSLGPLLGTTNARRPVASCMTMPAASSPHGLRREGLTNYFKKRSARRKRAQSAGVRDLQE